KNWDAHFDYTAYLARREIYQVAYLHNDWEVRLVRRDGGGVRGWIETGRRRVGRVLERVFEPETGALLKALVVGDRGGLTPETRGRFVAVGMSHVLSISGLHVGMLSLAVWLLCRALAARSTWLLLRFPVHKLAALGSLAPVLLYTAVAGARIPTVRAAIMIGLYQLAVLSGRDASLFRSLALAAFIAALVWPGAVMEASFQLSFLAVLSIGGGIRIFRGTWFMQPPEAPREGVLRRYRPAVVLSILVPVFATLGTGPVVAHHFGTLSLAGFIANPLLVPLVGFVIVPAGLLTGFLCLWGPAASTLLAGVVEPPARFFLWAVDFLAGLPMAAFSLPRPGWVMVGVSYLLILAAAACAHRFLRRFV
ncbi:MAG: ComEC/Rec2 family competence protein, partial [Deltaproteobacteria bacterium]|nr:ComEC/Rec2 family competence protein [Deltaproteobacteria bacterium]